MKIPALPDRIAISPEVYTVWLGTSEKIASFHQVKGYDARFFSCREHFLSFLCSLQDRGYRFQ